MRKQLARILVAASIVTAALAIIPGCKTSSDVNDQLIIDGTSTAVSVGLTFVKDGVQRQMIKNLLQGYAPGLRTITSNPTPQQLGQLIDQYTPEAIKQQYPQVVAFATPLVIQAVETAIQRYGKKGATVARIMNDTATGLELGSQ